ncbi:hypothetical protein [Streptomyces sp. NPDC101237]|uniref:hypothetical protein n=1 Tax=Streptomyces sp. NPDC101237 TaxID=3366139 RepID=UPI00380B6097
MGSAVRIVLACASGASNKDVAARPGSTPQAVGRRRARFVGQGGVHETVHALEKDIRTWIAV